MTSPPPIPGRLRIVMCIACDGFGWHDEAAGDADAADRESEAGECTWCSGIGYVYRDDGGHDRAIPPGDLAALHDVLETLETERLRALGYTGTAKKPWEQAARAGRNPLDGSVPRG